MFIVYDVTHDGILCGCKTISVANGACSGFVNALVAEFIDTPNYNFNDITTHWRYTKTSNILRILENPNHLDINYIEEKWINDRTIAILRSKYIDKLFIQCRQHVLRVIDNSDFGILEGYLSGQLNKCNPTESIYTSSIIEYAHLSEISVHTAYLELKMRHDSIGKVYLRNHAIIQKYIRKLNTAVTEDQMVSILSANNIEMLDRSYV